MIVLLINILITNNATKVLFIVISELTRGRDISQWYYVIVYILMQENPPMCKCRIVIARKFVIFRPSDIDAIFLNIQNYFKLQSLSHHEFCHVVF